MIFIYFFAIEAQSASRSGFTDATSITACEVQIDDFKIGMGNGMTNLSKRTP